MTMQKSIFQISAVLMALLACEWSQASSDEVYFEDAVRPILKAMCFHCHGEEEERKGGLDLRLVRFMHQGGDSGAAIGNGSWDEHLLWQRIATDEMPEGPKKLTQNEKEIVKKWLQSGAKTKRPEPENVSEVRFTQEELEFWAFQSPVKPQVPDVVVATSPSTIVNPIDSFVLQRLSKAGLTLSQPADPATLIRRLKLDLLGLPPSRAEVEEFLSDPSQSAYEALVDRFLDSPQFGVRWARHWLDVVGYSETDGNQGQDKDRKHAWRYRDYVIQAINSDKPYDQFLMEQIAGDEMLDGPPNAEDERHIELLTATGMLRMAPDVTATENTIMDRNQAVADVIKVVSSSVLGLSLGCAQCHDHRYDPISIDDYYRFRAVFDPAFPLEHWLQPEQRLIDMTTAADHAKGEEIEAEAKRMEEDIKARKRVVGQKIFDIKIAEVPEAIRAQVREAIETPEDKRTPEQKQLLLNSPMVRSVDAIVNQLVEFDKILGMGDYQKFKEEEKKLAEFRETKPPRRFIMAVRDRMEHLPESAVFFRGDPLQRKGTVQPGELFVLARQRKVPEIPVAKTDGKLSVGRRLAYAKQLTDGTHPLVARVAVNRLWQHHFGRGLVATPNDFGAFGQRPTHPELLDWLACDLVENGWRFKRIHKMIVMSQTYRQRSQQSSHLESVDPDNNLYSRANLRRMDAETIRDSMLFASGELNDKMGGPSVPVSEDGEGRAAIGKRILNEGLYAGLEDVGPEKRRRSIFLQSKRTLPLNLLEAFDMPVMNPNCDARRCSTVAPQSLIFLNDQTVIELAEKMCEKVWEIASSSETRIDELYLRLFSVPPTDDEKSLCISYITSQRERFAADPDPEWQKQVAQSSQAPDKRALASLAQTLMASNRFLYID